MALMRSFSGRLPQALDSSLNLIGSTPPGPLLVAILLSFIGEEGRLVLLGLLPPLGQAPPLQSQVPLAWCSTSLLISSGLRTTFFWFCWVVGSRRGRARRLSMLSFLRADEPISFSLPQ